MRYLIIIITYLCTTQLAMAQYGNEVGYGYYSLYYDKYAPNPYTNYSEFKEYISCANNHDVTISDFVKIDGVLYPAINNIFYPKNRHTNRQVIRSNVKNWLKVCSKSTSLSKVTFMFKSKKAYSDYRKTYQKVWYPSLAAFKSALSRHKGQLMQSYQTESAYSLIKEVERKQKYEAEKRRRAIEAEKIAAEGKRFERVKKNYVLSSRMKSKKVSIKGFVMQYNGNSAKNCQIEVEGRNTQLEDKTFNFENIFVVADSKGAFEMEIPVDLNETRAQVFTYYYDNKRYAETSDFVIDYLKKEVDLDPEKINYVILGKNSKSVDKKLYKKAIVSNDIEVLKTYLICQENGLYRNRILNKFEPLLASSIESNPSLEQLDTYRKYFPENELQIDNFSFKVAEHNNSIESVETYLSKYPKGNNFRNAKQILDDLYFEKAKKEDQIGTYETYITKFPAGKNITDAERRLFRLKDQKAFNEAKNSNTSYAFQRYIDKYPDGLYLTEARAENAKLKKNEADVRRKREQLANYKQFMSNQINELAREAMEHYSPNTGKSSYGSLLKVWREDELLKSKFTLNWKGYRSGVDEELANFWGQGARDFQVTCIHEFNPITNYEHGKVVTKNRNVREAINDEGAIIGLLAATGVATYGKYLWDEGLRTKTDSGDYGEEPILENELPCYSIEAEKKSYSAAGFGSWEGDMVFTIKCGNGKKKWIDYSTQHGYTPRTEFGYSDTLGEAAKRACRCY